MTNSLLGKLIRAYQLLISPIVSTLGFRCRFYPSCSEYARQAFEEGPWWRALGLTISRVSRCHPWTPGGVDLLPVKRKVL